MAIKTRGISAMRARVAAFFAATVLCLAMAWALPATADAEVYDTDTVGSIPLSANAAIKAAAPDLACGYGGLMTSDGKVLWSRNANAQVPMASTTKIMTAMVALDMGSVTDVITVSQQAAEMDGSTAELAEGDQLTLEQMLYAMMLPSGNDAAVAIAEHYGKGDISHFVMVMNEKAKAIGLSGTRFSSPSGLSDEGNYTTANDYLVLAKYAMGNPTFRQVVGTSEYTYRSTARNADVTVYSTNELLGQYDGMEGIKTGFTDAAGYCFVGACKRGDVELYSVVFNAPGEWTRFSDTVLLLDWGFEHYHPVTLISSGEQVGEAVATDWLDKTVPVVSGETVTVPVFDYDPDLKVEVEMTDRAGTIEGGSSMGTMSWLSGENLVATTPLVAGGTVFSPGLFEKVQIGWYKFSSFFTGDQLTAEQKVTAPPTYPLISAVV